MQEERFHQVKRYHLQQLKEPYHGVFAGALDND
jgi:hypothetical protein